MSHHGRVIYCTLDIRTAGCSRVRERAAAALRQKPEDAREKQVLTPQNLKADEARRARRIGTAQDSGTLPRNDSRSVFRSSREEANSRRSQTPESGVCLLGPGGRGGVFTPVSWNHRSSR